MSAKITLTVENGTSKGCADAVAAMFGRQEADAPVAVENGSALNFGTLDDKVSVSDGDTVSALFGKSGRLGMEAGRALTFQNRAGSVIPGDSIAVVGESYTALPNHDPKGL